MMLRSFSRRKGRAETVMLFILHSRSLEESSPPLLDIRRQPTRSTQKALAGAIFVLPAVPPLCVCLLQAQAHRIYLFSPHTLYLYGLSAHTQHTHSHTNSVCKYST
ncbi:hypothetical protein FKM82_002193 [Ascaphus truei]